MRQPLEYLTVLVLIRQEAWHPPGGLSFRPCGPFSLVLPQHHDRFPIHSCPKAVRLSGGGCHAVCLELRRA
jgi:hypothetical protein